MTGLYLNKTSLWTRQKGAVIPTATDRWHYVTHAQDSWIAAISNNPSCFSASSVGHVSETLPSSTAIAWLFSAFPFSLLYFNLATLLYNPVTASRNWGNPDNNSENPFGGIHLACTKHHKVGLYCVWWWWLWLGWVIFKDKLFQPPGSREAWAASLLFRALVL